MFWAFYSWKDALALWWDKPFTRCFVPGSLLVAGNPLFPGAVNLNWADKLTAPYRGRKCHHCPGPDWPASSEPVGRACIQSWTDSLRTTRAVTNREASHFPLCFTGIKQPRLRREPCGVFLMKSNNWAMDDGNLCAGNCKLQGVKMTASRGRTVS